MAALMNGSYIPKRLSWIAGALTVALSSTAVQAQAPPPPSPNGSDKPSPFKGVASKLGAAFDGSFHPVIQGIASGGGIGGGVGYDHPSTGPWQLSTKAVATIRRYWLME